MVDDGSATGFDQETIVALLGSAGDAPPAAVDAVQGHGLQALLTGTPATLQDISARSGLKLEEIRAGVEGLSAAGRIETNGEHVVGVSGLTVTETAHSLALADATMHTWCALDAIGIPVALALDADVSTACPHCGTHLDVTVRGGEAQADRPVRLFCPTGQCNDVRADFCAAANLFCDLDHLQAWRATNASVGGEELDLIATADLGRAMWGRFATRV
ncbi:MAG: organomercurial lyase [Acidimicrobiales bacterium]